MGRWAAGREVGRGLRAAGLLLAKPSKICTQKLTGENVTEKLSLSREAPFLLAMIVRGSIISLAGGSQCEPCVDIILREGVICL